MGMTYFYLQILKASPVFVKEIPIKSVRQLIQNSISHAPLLSNHIPVSYAVFDQTFFEKVCDQAFFEQVFDQTFFEQVFDQTFFEQVFDQTFFEQVFDQAFFEKVCS
jgi:hypothetical protein